MRRGADRRLKGTDWETVPVDRGDSRVEKGCKRVAADSSKKQ